MQSGLRLLKLAELYCSLEGLKYPSRFQLRKLTWSNLASYFFAVGKKHCALYYLKKVCACGATSDSFNGPGVCRVVGKICEQMSSISFL